MNTVQTPPRMPTSTSDDPDIIAALWAYVEAMAEISQCRERHSKQELISWAAQLFANTLQHMEAAMCNQPDDAQRVN
jgi:hypothetical protein